IQIYEPASLIVGTRGRSLGGVQGLLPGSVSKYCLQQSPVPVIVVRPSNKREKKKQKRRADPTREHYSNILRINDAVSGKIFESGGKLEEDGEAEAVAQAIGLPRSVTELPLRSSRSSLINKESTNSLKSSDDVRVMESPSGSNEDLGDDRKAAGAKEDAGAVASGALSPRLTTISFEDDLRKGNRGDVIILPSSPTSAASADSSLRHVKISTPSKEGGTTEAAHTLGLVSSSTSMTSTMSSSSSSTPPSQPATAPSEEHPSPANIPTITTSFEADTTSDAATSSKPPTPPASTSS
ncbi:hypothetical protein KEM56_004075, partial [Ascosphaera pollenicola]